MAKFPRLREIREQTLGWEVTKLATMLADGKPSISSIYRLEQGYAIRYTNAKRILDLLNGVLQEKLNAMEELV
jgi:hypothetical protein